MVNYKAGAPIASGGFGCVFRPPLKCEDPNLTKSTGVSKLMYYDYADSEMGEIDQVKPIIKKINNYNDYFLIDNINFCEPAPLSDEDRERFDTVCRNFNEKINKNNVNENLRELAIINIPDGGEELSKFFKKFVETQNTLSTLTTKQTDSKYLKHFENERNKMLTRNLNDFVLTNNSLIDLLNNGIIPLNKKNFLHLDIKGENILRNIESGKVYTRLIDWGLSGSYIPGKIPEIVENKVLQFNLPFGIILFSKNIKKIIKTYCCKTFPPPRELTKAIAEVIYKQKREKGHDKYIRRHIISKMELWAKTLKPDKISPLKIDDFLPENIIISNIASIIEKFVKPNGDFDDVKYFDEVFSKNVDICGVLTSYLSIVLETFNISTMKDHTDDLLVNKIWMLLAKYCFSTEYATEPIPIDTINKELKDLNKFTNNNKLYSKPKIKIKVLSPIESGEIKESKTKCVSLKLPQGRKRCSKGTRRSSKSKGICVKCE